MSDYYWQQSLPTITQMKYILQIYYQSEELADGTIQITCTNLNKEIMEHHTFIPSFYYKALIHTLWRYYLLINLHVHFKKNPNKKYTEFCPHLLRNIVLLDNVLEALIHPCMLIERQDIEGFQSANFEEYLCMEYLIGQHNPNLVNCFRAHCPINIKRIKDKFEWSWDAHKERVPTRFYGEQYDWDVENIPDADSGGTGAGSQGGNVPMGGVENSDPPPSNQASSIIRGRQAAMEIQVPPLPQVLQILQRIQWGSVPAWQHYKVSPWGDLVGTC
ncbi:hypothetical protein F5J12DRAFT_787393 [Pisolithus orientalis]|uniref:uncharacterized protein n=1 Tax=Pisolithus orientalis TaxID=936130 RepID=UPI002224CD9F|nr:uncharacterized protein F5J12DRAFT_787393 [Pisolithus orientalis]KAI5985433.1 hypothetical protein F5J12DRAFT_787393 [Pisolithus orientalis]